MLFDKPIAMDKIKMKRRKISVTVLIVVALCLWTGKAFAQLFPEKPTARLGKGAIEKIAYTPDGKLLAVAGSVGIWLYDATDLTEVGLLESTWVNSLAISPDGKTIASWSTLWDADFTVRLWHVETKQQIGLFKHPHIASSVAFSPDGTLLASGDFSGNTRLWNIESKQQVALLEPRLGHNGWVHFVVFSPDGKTIISWGNGNVHLWDVETKQEVAQLEAGLPVFDFSPDGKIIVGVNWGDSSVESHTP
jgi:WD40 repeat protein